MAPLTQHLGSQFVKLLYLGDSGTGKTGSLTSLVEAGYKLRILDLDNGLDVLKAFVTKECPDKLVNIDYETRRDKYKATAVGAAVSGMPKAFIESLGLMTKWTDGTFPSEWGPECIFIIDSLTGLGKAALEWAKGMNPTSAQGNRMHGQSWYWQAQQALDHARQSGSAAPPACLNSAASARRGCCGLHPTMA